MDKKPVVGIDLGTTYSCIGVFIDGEVKIIPNEIGENTTPSVVHFGNDGITVGNEAKKYISTDPRNTVYAIKRFMGLQYEDPFVQTDIDTVPYAVEQDINGFCEIPCKCCGSDVLFSPEQISAEILKKLVKSASNYLKTEVKDAVITVPAYFTQTQKQATINAGNIAGLNVKRIINEPTAAAIAYGLNTDLLTEHKCVVIDFGGGTYDVTIMSIYNNDFRVLSTAGDTHLGGKDFDQCILDDMVIKCRDLYKIDVRKNTRVMSILRSKAELIKKRLSEIRQHDEYIPQLLDGKDFQYSIDRKRFEEITQYFIQRLDGPLQEAIQGAKLTVSDITDVILVGGSSRIPAVKSFIENKIPSITPTFPLNPDEAIAYGAAICGSLESGDDLTLVNHGNLVLVDIIPLSLGILCQDGSMNVIIPKYQPFGTTMTQYYKLRDVDTGVTITVYEGERLLAKENCMLGTFVVQGLPPGADIEVTFTVSKNGILNVTCQQLGGSISDQLTIKYDNHRLDDAKLEEMRNKSREFDADDIHQIRKNGMILRMNELLSHLTPDQNTKYEKLIQRCLRTAESSESVIQDIYDVVNNLLKQIRRDNSSFIFEWKHPE